MKPSHASKGASSGGIAQHAAHAAAVPPPTIPTFFNIFFMVSSSINASKKALPELYFLK